MKQFTYLSAALIASSLMLSNLMSSEEPVATNAETKPIVKKTSSKLSGKKSSTNFFISAEASAAAKKRPFSILFAKKSNGTPAERLSEAAFPNMNESASSSEQQESKPNRKKAPTNPVAPKPAVASKAPAIANSQSAPKPKAPSPKKPSAASEIDILLEGQAAYYYPTSNNFRSIYPGAGLYGLELSVQAYKGLYAWTSANILVQEGHVSGSSSKTHLTYVPIGAGLKYIWKVDFTEFYVGAGVVPAYVHIHDHSSYVVEHLSKWGCGGIAKAGIMFNLPESFFINIFANYTYLKVHNHDTNHGAVIPHTADLSGVSLGASIGYRFRVK